MRRFLSAVGTDPDELPDDLLSAATALVPVFRSGRPYFDATPPIHDIAAATYLKLVVSDGHNDGWEAMCAALAERIGADHIVIEGPDTKSSSPDHPSTTSWPNSGPDTDSADGPATHGPHPTQARYTRR